MGKLFVMVPRKEGVVRGWGLKVYIVGVDQGKVGCAHVASA